MWLIYAAIAVTVTAAAAAFTGFVKVGKLKKELLFLKKIIESKSKSHLSGSRRKIYEKGLIVSFDNSGLITAVNDAFSEFLGFEKNELVGNHIIGTLIPEKDDNGNDMSNLVDYFMSNPKLYLDIETEVLNKKKDKLWVSWTNRAIYDGEGKITAFTCVGFDITARKLLEKELQEISSSDVIAGIYNKTTFMDIGNKELLRAVRYNRDLSLVVFIVHRNRNFDGARDDDAFLQGAVDLCKSLVRDCDYIGRIGDVEFAILLPETPLANANILVDRIKSKAVDLAEEDSVPFIIDTIGAAGRQAGDKTVDHMVIRAVGSLKQFQFQG